MTAEPDLAALSDKEFAGVRQTQMMRIEAIAGLNALIEPLTGVTSLIRDHSALTRTCRSTCHGGSSSQSGFRFIGESAETHTGNVNRDVENQRFLRTRTQYRLGHTAFTISFDHKSGERSRQECQFVECGNFLEQRKTPHAIPSEFRLDMDIVDSLR